LEIALSLTTASSVPAPVANAPEGGFAGCLAAAEQGAGADAGAPASSVSLPGSIEIKPGPPIAFIQLPGVPPPEAGPIAGTEPAPIDPAAAGAVPATPEPLPATATSTEAPTASPIPKTPLKAPDTPGIEPPSSGLPLQNSTQPESAMAKESPSPVAAAPAQKLHSIEAEIEQEPADGPAPDAMPLIPLPIQPLLPTPAPSVSAHANTAETHPRSGDAATDTASAGTERATLPGLLALHEQPLGTASTNPSEALREAAPPPPARQVATVAIALAFAADPTRGFTLALEPAELGRVEIQVTQEDGRHSITLIAERPETLALLQRDRGELGQSLAQAGLSLDPGGVGFALAQGGAGSDGQPDREGRRHSGGHTPEPIIEAAPRMLRGLVDLHV
jgi:Meckel syndrome type 1 protein